MIESGESNGGAGEDKMLFESAMDKTFQKFADRMAQNPEQVLRYEFGGSPLLYSTTDAVGKLLAPANSASKVTTAASVDGSRIPRCAACGSSRLFELQLTPHAITVLEENEMSIEGMDWGTVILAACGKDCSPHGTEVGQVGYTEEWVGVQWEELEGSRK
jgi:pre-rRNA-processing protein TSR4